VLDTIESKYVFEFLFNGFLQGEGVEASVSRLQLEFAFGAERPALEQSLVGGLGRVVTFVVAGKHPLFADQFHVRAEKVLIRTPLVPIEIIDQSDQLGVFQSVPTQEVPHMRPVLLLDVGVVVFVIGSRTGEGDWMRPAGEILQQRIVEELREYVFNANEPDLTLQEQDIKKTFALFNALAAPCGQI
jgi:hypothetical protein